MTKERRRKNIFAYSAIVFRLTPDLAYLKNCAKFLKQRDLIVSDKPGLEKPILSKTTYLCCAATEVGTVGSLQRNQIPASSHTHK